MNIRKLCVLSFALYMLAGCAGLPVEQEYLNKETVLPEPERIGIYHKVKKDETLWRIAKAYDVPIEDIIRSNNIPDAARLEKNQLVFIPGVYTERHITVEPKERENDFAWPVKGDVISYFHTVYDGMLNKGIDIAAAQGTTVEAARSGTVVFADQLTGYGETVVLKHTGGFDSVYADNSELLVKEGQYVTKHTPIAIVGRGNGTSYLHFEIRKDAIESNPLHYLP